jgi:hypothetical protein
MANAVQDLLRQSRKSWASLTHNSVWVISALGAFLVPPPNGSPKESHIWVRFGQFAITIVVGLVSLLMLRWKQKTYALRWGAVSILFLLLGSAAFFAYEALTVRWTAKYDVSRVMIGSVYTDWGNEYREKHPQLSAEGLVWEFAGQVEKIWTKESLDRRRILLAGIYVLVIPLFTISVMSLGFALRCMAGSSTAHRRTK